MRVHKLDTLWFRRSWGPSPARDNLYHPYKTERVQGDPQEGGTPNIKTTLYHSTDGGFVVNWKNDQKREVSNKDV